MIAAAPAPIVVGIGGWTFPPWRGVFYPDGLPHAGELAYAADHLTSIEINATFHGSQKPDSFRRWRAAVPAGFVFSVKAPRAATWRRDLAEAGPAIDRFLASGVTELGDKLGPILWQLPPTRRFEPAAIEPFLALLPRTHDGIALRHAIEAPHPSFADPAFSDTLRRQGIAWALIDADDYPAADTTTAAFVYARLKRSRADARGYPAAALDTWRDRFVSEATAGRPCFVYVIGGDKIFAPAAAMGLLSRLVPPAKPGRRSYKR